MSRELFKEMIDEGASITLVRTMNVGRYPGREYRFTQDSSTGLAQLYLTGKKSYAFMAYDDVKHQSKEDFDRFDPSVRLAIK